jgi:hypothetical protein
VCRRERPQDDGARGADEDDGGTPEVHQAINSPSTSLPERGKSLIHEPQGMSLLPWGFGRSPRSCRRSLDAYVSAGVEDSPASGKAERASDTYSEKASNKGGAS